MKSPMTIALLATAAAFATAAIGKPSNGAGPPKLVTQTTEEGQVVSFDGYTWQRRELAKRLPLSEAWPSEATINAQFKRFGLDHPAMSADLKVPARVLQDVYVVNSKPNLTYLIDAGPGNLVLIDPGFTSNVEFILRNVEALGFSRNSIKWVINTHAHFDHSMADAAFQRLGAKILVGRADVEAVEKGTAVTAKYALPAKQIADYPTLHVDRAIDDGEELNLGNKTLLAIRTPGHTDGSTCFLLMIEGKKVLFGGDTILFDYRLGDQRSPFADDTAYLASLKKLIRVGAYPPGSVGWDVLLPGHGTIVIDRAYQDVLKGERQVQLDMDNGEPVSALPFGTDAYRRLMFGRP